MKGLHIFYSHSIKCGLTLLSQNSFTLSWARKAGPVCWKDGCYISVGLGFLHLSHKSNNCKKPHNHKITPDSAALTLPLSSHCVAGGQPSQTLRNGLGSAAKPGQRTVWQTGPASHVMRPVSWGAAFACGLSLALRLLWRGWFHKKGGLWSRTRTQFGNKSEATSEHPFDYLANSINRYFQVTTVCQVLF